MDQAADDLVVFYIHNSEQLIEYNVLSKKKYIRYQCKENTTIRDYHIDRCNEIVFIKTASGHKLLWNTKEREFVDYIMYIYFVKINGDNVCFNANY